MRTNRDNVKVGLFVLTGIVLGLVVVFTLADLSRLFESKQQWLVFYHLSDGLKGLKEGALVTLGEQPAGEVVGIENEFESTPDGERVIGKLVTISIPVRIQLFENATIELLAPPLGSGTKLNIRHVGQGQRRDPTKPIMGQLAVSELTESLVREMGIRDEQRQQLQNIIANIDAMMGKLRDDLPQIASKAKKVLTDAVPLVKNANDALADLRLAIDDVKQVSRDVRQRSERWMDHIDKTTETLDRTVATTAALVKDKAPDIRTVIENIRDVTQAIKDENLDQLREALQSGQAALRKVKTTTDELGALITGQRPVLERMLANLQVTAGQLKLAAIEVRRSPWRLLYQPKEKELETDNLYDASRSFALAAGVLDATAQSLQSVAHKSPKDAEQINKMLNYLEKIVSKFQEAEDAFWVALKKHVPE